ncbi:hypothetical protein LA080_012284 [Diaporthe eres]|nr:hypothetical protein LA080_012284 [Diaporthe eres]
MILRFTFAWAVAVAGQSTSDNRFIGWYIQPDSTQRMTAGTGWSTSGTLAGDCAPSSSCVLHTGCTSNTLLFANGDIMTCNSDFGCVAMTIFETIPFGAPCATNWECRHTRGRTIANLLIQPINQCGGRCNWWRE